MRFFEFAITPQTSSSIKDLEYLLTNADVDPNTLQKALAFLKKDSQEKQEPLKKPKEPAQQAPAQQAPAQQTTQPTAPTAQPATPQETSAPAQTTEPK